MTIEEMCEPKQKDEPFASVAALWGVSSNMMRRKLRIVEREEESNEELVLRARRGDRDAFALIFRRYAPDVLDLATRMLRNHSEADDVVQDTFTAAMKSIQTLEDGTRLRIWLLTIAVFRVRRRFRVRSLRKWVFLDSNQDAPLDLYMQSDGSAEARAELSMLSKALDRLPEEERVAFSLRKIEGLELAEVSEIMSLSLATVKRRIEAAEISLQPFRSSVREPTRAMEATSTLGGEE